MAEIWNPSAPGITLGDDLPAQLPKKPSEKAESDFHCEGPEAPDEESWRLNIHVFDVFTREFFPKIATAMYRADGIGDVAHRLPLSLS